MGTKTIVGVWMCTVALTAMAAFLSPNSTAKNSQPELNNTASTVCSALEAQSTCVR